MPREIFDPGEDLTLPEDLLSEIGRTERYWARKKGPSAGMHWSRFRALRLRTDIEVIDLTLAEANIAAEVTGRNYLRQFGRAGRLGKGEASVIALVESRKWVAVVDDAAARDILLGRATNARVFTTTEVLRRAAFQGSVTSPMAEQIYQTMRQFGYWGPEHLWVV